MSKTVRLRRYGRNVGEKTTLPMDLEISLHWKISTLSPSCVGNVHILSQLYACMRASVHTLSPISTHESSYDVNGPVSISESIIHHYYRAIG